MNYEINSGAALLPVGVGQYGIFQYLNSQGWPLLEPGGRPLDDFILSHDPALADQLRLNYISAPYGGCDENGCSVWGTVPAWKSPNYTNAINNEANPQILLTADEHSLLTNIGYGNGPISYEYGPPLAPFAPIAPIAPPPVRLPPIVDVDPSPLFPAQTVAPGPVTPIPAPVTLGPGDAPDFGPAPAEGGALALRLGLLALVLLR